MATKILLTNFPRAENGEVTFPADADTRGMRLFNVQLCCIICTTSIILVRAYVKTFVVRKVGLDDWLMFLAAALYLPYGIIAMHGVVAGGTGKPVGTYTLKEAEISLRAWYTCEVLYSPITIAIRLSICIFLLRLAVMKLHRWILIVNIGIITIISIAYFFVMVLQCDPPHHFWKQVYGDSGTCIDPNIVPNATIAHSVISAVSDWIVGLLPIVILWHVKINRRTKATIALLLSFGIIAGIVILIRIPYLKRLQPSLNFLYETLDIAVLTVFEPALGIIAGSLPALRPLFKKWNFGIRTNSRRTLQSPSWRSPASGLSGSSRKVEDMRRYLEDDHCSETELHTTAGRTSSSGPASAWDIESGVVSPLQPPPPRAVHIHTHINVSSRAIDELPGVPMSNSDASGDLKTLR